MMGMAKRLSSFRRVNPVNTSDRDEAILKEFERKVAALEHEKIQRKHQHIEAFHLMRYRCKDGHDEIVWNSRDGVTPFTIDCRTCNQEATHVEWNRDVYAPNHQPKPGDRIFVDLTEQRARAEAQRLVAERWDKEPSPYRELFPDGTQEDATEKLVQSWLSQLGQPHLVEFRP